jgi:hypothetical protein
MEVLIVSDLPGKNAGQQRPQQTFESVRRHRMRLRAAGHWGIENEFIQRFPKRRRWILAVDQFG